MADRVPIRLLVHYQTAQLPLVQVTEGVQAGRRIAGTGTRAIDVTKPEAEIPLFDPATGQPTGEKIRMQRALIILYSIARQTP